MTPKETKEKRRLESEKRRKNPAYRELQKQRYKDWYAREGKDPERLARKAEQMRKYTRDPKLRAKHEARWQINRMKTSGKIQSQPCANCGAMPSQAHHPDYSKPLLVVWLCGKCHQAEHAKAEGRE